MCRPVKEPLSTMAPSPSEPQEQEDNKPTCWQRSVQFYWDNEFVILIVVVILLARAYPPLGAVYLAPQITATWIAVVFIFGKYSYIYIYCMCVCAFLFVLFLTHHLFMFTPIITVMAGLGLKTEELSNALQQIRFNVFVQTFNFGIVSVTVFLLSRLFIYVDILAPSLADGMVVCASLPLTINMVCVLTKSAGGDEAAAIFNAAFGNMVGVFLSPILILGYLGVTSDVDLFDVFYKLMLRVVVPVAVGQILQKCSKTVVQFVKVHKPKFKYLQQYALIFIVYTVFCKTFEAESQSSIGDIFLMILFQFLLLVLFMGVSWILLGMFFPNDPALRVMGLFGCTHKTVAMGVPLINAIYESSPFVGQYTLPLLIWHPMQLLVGSFFVPRLLAFVERENERLGIRPDDCGDDGDDNSNDNVVNEIENDEERGTTKNDESAPSTGDPDGSTNAEGIEVVPDATPSSVEEEDGQPVAISMCTGTLKTL